MRLSKSTSLLLTWVLLLCLAHISCQLLRTHLVPALDTQAQAGTPAPLPSNLSFKQASCGPDPSAYLGQNPCCLGDGCCDGPVGIRSGSGQRPWTGDTDLVVVAPHVKPTKHMRGEKHSSRLEWLVKQDDLPVVLCPTCVAEADPVCSIESSMGGEASVYLAFIVYNYDRLPRAVAFLHGHEHIQCNGTKAETNLDRLRALRPRVDDDSLVFFGTGRSHSRASRGMLRRWDALVSSVTGEDVPPDVYDFQEGAHFIAGRERIRARPLASWKKLLDFASGRQVVEGAELWVDGGNFTYAPGHQMTGAFILETWWPLLLTGAGAPDPFGPDSLTCSMGWCSEWPPRSGAAGRGPAWAVVGSALMIMYAAQ